MLNPVVNCRVLQSDGLARLSSHPVVQNQDMFLKHPVIADYYKRPGITALLCGRTFL